MARNGGRSQQAERDQLAAGGNLALVTLVLYAMGLGLSEVVRGLDRN